MSRRRLFSLLNTVALALALVVWFLFPRYAAYALYGIVVWVAVGFVVTWSTLRAPTTAPSAPGGAPGGALRTGGPSVPPTAGGSATIDFCVYCGNHYAPEERRCAACGHPLPPHAVPS